MQNGPKTKEGHYTSKPLPTSYEISIYQKDTGGGQNIILASLRLYELFPGGNINKLKSANKTVQLENLTLCICVY